MGKKIQKWIPTSQVTWSKARIRYCDAEKQYDFTTSIPYTTRLLFQSLREREREVAHAEIRAPNA